MTVPAIRQLLGAPLELTSEPSVRLSAIVPEFQGHPRRCDFILVNTKKSQGVKSEEQER